MDTYENACDRESFTRADEFLAQYDGDGLHCAASGIRDILKWFEISGGDPGELLAIVSGT